MVEAMEIQRGFKKTDVGIISDEWIVDTLGNVITVLTDFPANGSFASLAQKVKYLDKPDYARLIRLTDIRANFKNDGIYISKDAYEFLSKSKLYGEELLLANVGAYAGYSFAYPEGLPFKGSLGPNMFLIKFNEKIITAKYAFYTFSFDIILQQLLSKAASSAQPKLNKQNVRECLVCFPPTKAEQTAIATALNDADALITQLEKLIAKKRAIKQGAMQELLKPKEGCEVEKLPELIWFQEGPGVRKSQFRTSGVKLLNGTNIEKGKLLLDKTDRFISEHEAYGWYSHFLVDDGDILIACSGISVDKFDEKVTEASSIHLPLCMNTSTMRFKVISKRITKSFFFHFLKSYSFKQQIGEQITGSAQLNFGPAHVKWVDINFPSPTEQDEIAQILSDMDSEIDALEKKLDKYKMLKQGMMQNLLTGKIRLMVNC